MTLQHPADDRQARRRSFRRLWLELTVLLALVGGWSWTVRLGWDWRSRVALPVCISVAGLSLLLRWYVRASGGR